MELTPYVDDLRRELATALDTTETGDLLERLIGSLEPAIRLTLLDALAGAMGEITRDLAPGSVDLRLRGREATFVVTPPPAQPPPSPESFGGEAVARINLRVPEQLKAAIETAAGEERRSVNAWLVEAASVALPSQRHGK
ncbi:toxin-antitoxin system HicB family antitoxin [Amycolatopsis albispora]|uniref:toxin-antitoxin system HicB family antitoxin n=1 Tax=Amycolatopsis albispora TaxID=1804986 RepID=UPI000DE29FD6|nr:toxin-antitoxin system HicB family antitoxin [Amycolatopsis albispora]